MSQLYKSPVVLALASVLGAKSAEAQGLDIGAVSDIGRSLSAAMVRDWSNAENVLFEQGICDPAQVLIITELVPEILADLYFIQADCLGHLGDVRLTVSGLGQKDLELSLRDLPLYRSLSAAWEAQELPQELVTALIRHTGLASAIAKTLETGTDIEGAVLSVSPVGVVHDGNRLVLARQ